MHRLRTLLLVLALAAPACDRAEDAATQAESLQGPATELLALLAANRYGELAQRMHFPAIYTNEQLLEDRSEFVTVLSGLMEQTGEITGQSPSTGGGPFLQIKVAGGNDSYWKAHSAGQGGSTVAFDVEFSKIGSGVVQIAFLENAGVREVRSINIGVKGSRPDARETMESVMRGLQASALEIPEAETTAQK